jgi:hypothetical protein
VATRFEYQVVDFDRTNVPDGVSVGEGMARTLNNLAARGWHLDQFWDSEDGDIRHMLLRREAKPSWVTYHELTSLA